jgi:hypothetical protein
MEEAKKMAGLTNIENIVRITMHARLKRVLCHHGLLSCGSAEGLVEQLQPEPVTPTPAGVRPTPYFYANYT